MTSNVNSEADQLSLAYLKNHPVDAGKVLDTVESREVINLLQDAPIRIIAPVLSAMSPHRAARAIQLFDNSKQALIYKEIGLHRTASIMRHIPAVKINKLLSLLPHTFAIRLRMVLQYPQGSVGSVMSTYILIADTNHTVEDVIKLSQHSVEISDSDVYVVDGAECYKGCVSLATVLANPKHTHMSDIMETTVPTVSVRESIESITNHSGWIQRRSLPVVDRHNRLLGSVHYASIYDAPGYTETSAGINSYLVSEIFELYWHAWLSVINVILTRHKNDG